VADLRETLKSGQRLEVKDPASGNLIRWTVQGLLQEGGRGLVFEVADPEGRPAVLKGPSRAPGAAYSAIIEREILKKVSPHASLVKYLGSTDQGGMPLVLIGWAHENAFLRLNSPPARDRVQGFRDSEASGIALPATVAVECVFEVVLALEHLHSCGFVHSDVKPANVMMEIDPVSRDLDDAEFFRAVAEGRSRAILIDVGGARSESFLEDLNAGTVDASIVPPELTPIWAPPEAVVGAETREGRRPIYSAAIDVYQAGLLLGTFLTGRAPYEHLADRYDRNDIAQVMELKAAERRGELTAFPPGIVRMGRHEDTNWDADGGRSTRPDFDDAVESILARTLARDAKERGSIAQLRVAMERSFDLFPNAKSRGGSVAAPTFRARSRTIRLENRLTAAAALGSRSGGGAALPSDAAAQVLKMAAELAGGLQAAPAPKVGTGRVPVRAAPAAPGPAAPAAGSGPQSVVRPSAVRMATPAPLASSSATGSGPALRPAATGEVLLDRVTLRVSPKDTTKTFEVLSREGARQLVVEGGRFEFNIAPTKASELLRLVLEARVDVFFFERKKGTPKAAAPPG
jgi:serine/threonine protein kinase